MDVRIKNRDIIVMGIQAWDIEIGSNCKNIALEMSKHNRVLYVNPPMDRISRFRERNTTKIKKRKAVRNGQLADLVPLGEQFWNLYPKSMTESINWISSPALFDWANRRNAKRFYADIQSAMCTVVPGVASSASPPSSPATKIADGASSGTICMMVMDSSCSRSSRLPV